MNSTEKQPHRYVFWPELSCFMPRWAALLIWYGWLPFACAIYLLLRKLGVVRNIFEEGAEYWLLFGWPIAALAMHLIDWVLWRLTKGRAAARVGRQETDRPDAAMHTRTLDHLDRGGRWFWITSLGIVAAGCVFAMLPDLYPRWCLYIPFSLGAVYCAFGFWLDRRYRKSLRDGGNSTDQPT